MKFQEIVSGSGSLFGIPVQGESTLMIKIINAKNESSTYKANYSLTGSNGFGNLDSQANLNCKLIDTYSL